MNEYIGAVNRNAFTIKKKNGLKLLTVNKLNEEGFTHGFTTRLGGVSPNEFKSLNLSVSREENRANKAQNYKRVCDALNIDYESLSLVNYEHGANVYLLKDRDRGNGISKSVDIPYCDALITDNNMITALTLHADCVPVFMADKKTGAAGVAHAGCKGTLSGIAFNMVQAFKISLKSEAQNLIVGIGPHIMPCCFEVKDDVAEKFLAENLAFAVNKNKNKIFVDLQMVLLNQLEKAGILPQNIYCADMCTYCRDDLFYSHRRDNGRTGAMGAFITARNI